MRVNYALKVNQWFNDLTAKIAEIYNLMGVQKFEDDVFIEFEEIFLICESQVKLKVNMYFLHNNYGKVYKAELDFGDNQNIIELSGNLQRDLYINIFRYSKNTDKALRLGIRNEDHYHIIEESNIIIFYQVLDMAIKRLKKEKNLK